MKRDKIILLAATSIVLVALVFLVVGKERLRTSGEQVYLELAPVDPRSLIQGDYMVLDYAITRDAMDALYERDASHANTPHTVPIIAALDERRVATFARLATHDEEPTPDEVLLLLERGKRGLDVGAESFFFQEGHAPLFEQARFGELRVTEKGKTLLIGLSDEGLSSLGPPRW